MIDNFSVNRGKLRSLGGDRRVLDSIPAGDDYVVEDRRIWQLPLFLKDEQELT